MIPLEKNKKHVKIVGVLNVTPDSFSDGGKFLDPKKAVAQAEKMLSEGANIIDVGGESTAPHNTEISEQEEWTRLETILPVLLEKKIPLSLDSQKAAIWEKFLEHGGSMINDVSGLQKDQKEKILLLNKYPHAKIVIMFSRNISQKDPENCREKIVPEISDFFLEKIDLLEKNGIDKSRIVLDPGMGGFLSKNPEISFMVLRKISVFQSLGCELYIGTSRKSFLSEISSRNNPSERLISSVVSSLLAVQNGASYVRMHDVAAMKEALDTYEKISG